MHGVITDQQPRNHPSVNGLGIIASKAPFSASFTRGPGTEAEPSSSFLAGPEA